jgi:hypothetical protein
MIDERCTINASGRTRLSSAVLTEQNELHCVFVVSKRVVFGKR